MSSNDLTMTHTCELDADLNNVGFRWGALSPPSLHLSKGKVLVKGEVHQKGKKLVGVMAHYGDHLFSNSKFVGNSNPELSADISIGCYFVDLLISNVLTSDRVVDPYFSASSDSLILCMHDSFIPRSFLIHELSAPASKPSDFKKVVDPFCVRL